jgi:hypothetical protein
MYIIGGTYSEFYIDPVQVPIDDLILNFDMDASTWAKVKIKESTADTQMPWNLVFHSNFKIDASNIGFIWYDYDVMDDDKYLRNRMMKLSVLNLTSGGWKEIKM